MNSWKDFWKKTRHREKRAGSTKCAATKAIKMWNWRRRC